MRFHLALLSVSQLLEEVIFQIVRRATHDIPRADIGARSAFRRSSAVYSRDFTVETGHSRISAISSNLKPW